MAFRLPSTHGRGQVHQAFVCGRFYLVPACQSWSYCWESRKIFCKGIHICCNLVVCATLYTLFCIGKWKRCIHKCDTDADFWSAMAAIPRCLWDACWSWHLSCLWFMCDKLKWCYPDDNPTSSVSTFPQTNSVYHSNEWTGCRGPGLTIRWISQNGTSS